MARRSALLIVNQKSREGETGLEQIAELLNAIDLIEAVSHHPGQVSELIRQHQKDVDSVILGGGDGTLNAAVGALLETGLPLGILPLGTANDLARTLAIPLELEGACRVIAEGHRRRINLGTLNDCYFFNVAHIGLGVQVSRQLSREIKSQWGVFAYFHSLLMAFKQNRPFRATIEYDNQRIRVRSIEIAVGNGRHYGGGMTIAAEATITDDHLYLYSIKPVGLWNMIRLAPALRMGPQRSEEAIELLKAREISIRTRRPMEVYADGESMTHTPVHFRVLVNALSVYAPEHTPTTAVAEE